MHKYADVIVEVAVSGMDKRYIYKTPFEVEIGDRVIVPFGKRNIEGYVVELKDEADYPEEKIKSIISKLDEEPAVLPELIDLAVWMKKKYRCMLVDCLRLMIPAQMRGENAVGPLVRKAVRLKKSADDADFSRAKKQLEALRTIESMGGEVFLSTLPDSYAAVKALEKKGYVEVIEKPLRRSPFLGGYMPMQPLFTPTEAQKSAIDEMGAAMESGGGRFLLNGVTGSGKTEVYCHLVRKALDMGKQAIILVPEIALTPQMVDWFSQKFGDNAAVLHSRLSAGERFDEWWRIRTGQAQVVVGARSAVFAPVSDLGLIVVDEEHETSYNSEKTPKYDTREVAIQRCAQKGAVLVLGSATPQIKTYHNALRGYYNLIELHGRVNGKPLPEVNIVDMREELVKGNRSMFSGALIKALRECFEKGQQAMLFMNRRGYNTFVSCRSCGKTVKCPACDVAMTYHQGDSQLRCHYCGYSCPPPKTCPECGSNLIRYFGSGTERVEDEINKLFPGITVARMDADTTAGKDGHLKILTEFREGRAQLLIGTQMIAKGHDFPSVTVVGVVSCDMMLSMPDYRSPERAFGLLTQVAGRAGRAKLPGKVFFQTYDPDHYAIQYAAKQDYRAFYMQEIGYRRKGLFPPYTVYARLLFSGPDEGKLMQAAKQANSAFESWISENPQQRKNVLHYRSMEAPIAYIKGNHRWQIFFKISAARSEEILDFLSALSQEGYKGAKCELEINPQSML
ncbi:MAG: primosomal protein N' [Clostridia bacterium]|nr:primosomal protein N' [Clostridia bacterium]